METKDKMPPLPIKPVTVAGTGRHQQPGGSAMGAAKALRLPDGWDDLDRRLSETFPASDAVAQY